MSDANVTKSIAVEGYTVAEAVRAAAKELGVDPHLVNYTIDPSHFRNSLGRSRPVDTVKIIASAVPSETFEGAQRAKEWLEGLVQTMRLAVDIDMKLGEAPRTAKLRVRGKGAKRLSLIEEALLVLVHAVLQNEGLDWRVKLFFPGHEPEQRRDSGDRGDRGGRERGGRDRDDRRGGRDRDDRRGPRRDDRRGGGGRDRDERRGGGRRDDRDNAEREQELRTLAQRLAQKAAESGEAITIRRPLNSYERRLVHMEVAEIAGVVSESQTADDGSRTVMIRPGSPEGSDAE